MKTQKFNLTNKGYDTPLILAPGKYWVGDPCYVYPDAEWSNFCNELFKHNGPVTMNFNGTDFFVCGTAYGDGCYSLKENGKIIGDCGVDAGLTSVIPEKLIKKWNSKKEYNGVWPDMGGVWIEITKSCEVEPYGSGNYKFGPFDMNTERDDEDSLDEE